MLSLIELEKYSNKKNTFAFRSQPKSIYIIFKYIINT